MERVDVKTRKVMVYWNRIPEYRNTLLEYNTWAVGISSGITGMKTGRLEDIELKHNYSVKRNLGNRIGTAVYETKEMENVNLLKGNRCMGRVICKNAKGYTWNKTYLLTYCN